MRACTAAVRGHWSAFSVGAVAGFGTGTAACALACAYLYDGPPPALRRGSTTAAPLARSGPCASSSSSSASESGRDAEKPITLAPGVMARYEEKLRKLQRATQERVFWKSMNREMLGLGPRLWMEVLDPKHRYATLLYAYWRRWAISDTHHDFFEWLDEGWGSLIDLPEFPRRLLDEWCVIYVRRDEQPHFRVRIENGRFLWDEDGSPVTVPYSPLPLGDEPERATPRERAVAKLLKPRLEKGRRRDRLLAEALEEAERAMKNGEEAAPERLEKLLRPLIQEGLLCMLRDPYFADRQDAACTPGGHNHLLSLPRLPVKLLDGLRWEDVRRAIHHDQGLHMKNPFPKGDARGEGKGIFVWSPLGPLYCATKIRGVFHHSSVVRGHCVKVAGGLKIVDGWLTEFSPHSGHYQPGGEHVEDMIKDWKARGVDFSRVTMKPYIKEPMTH